MAGARARARLEFHKMPDFDYYARRLSGHLYIFDCTYFLFSRSRPRSVIRCVQPIVDGLGRVVLTHCALPSVAMMSPGCPPNAAHFGKGGGYGGEDLYKHIASHCMHTDARTGSAARCARQIVTRAHADLHIMVILCAGILLGWASSIRARTT